MLPRLAALVAGLLFGAGLTVSQMINPAKVLAFLDLAGAWDPSLLLVMASAVAVSALGTILARHRDRPLLAPSFQIPSRRDIDGKLIAGSAIFGLGWGLYGYCPGPALAGLTLGARETLGFVVAMVIGMALHRWPFWSLGARSRESVG